jgi:hypothetical protein
MVLKGVGAAMIIKYEIGRLIEIKELILMGHGINS